MQTVGIESIISLIESKDILIVEGFPMKSHCIFRNPESRIFLWINPFYNDFIQFYRKDNFLIEYNDLNGETFYVKDQYGITFGITPKLLNDLI